MKQIKIYILFFTFLLSANIIQAQHKAVKFDRLTTRDGLSQNRVFDIIQDRQGYIWIATEDGLNRYDGYHFRIFKNVPGDSLALADNIIQVLHESKSGNIWVGTQNGGLSKYNAEREFFENHLHTHTNPITISENNIVALSEDKKGNLWIGTASNGFDYFDTSNIKFIHMAQMLPPGYQLNRMQFNFIHQDQQNQLWVGSAGKVHLFKIGYTDSGFPQLTPVKIRNNIFSSAVTCIEEDKNGDFWIGTFNEGLFRINKSTNTLNPYHLKNTALRLNNINISSIQADSSGNLWIAGVPNGNLGGGLVVSGKSYGVIKLEVKTGKISRFINDPEDESSISSDKILSLFIDRTGVLWAGSWLSGVNKYDKSVIKFSLYQADLRDSTGLTINSTRGFYEDENYDLWIASSGGGLIKYNKDSGKYEHFNHDPADESSISSVLARCIYDDGEYLWVGTMNGLNRFDKVTKKFKRFYLDPSNISNTANSVTYNIIEIDTYPGYLWYGSLSAGLVRFDKKTHTFKNFTYDPEDENCLNSPDNYVFTVWHSKSRPNELWTGTTSGINILDLDSGIFRYYVPNPKDSSSLSNPNVMNFHEDEDGLIWIATYGGGINRFDPKTENFLRFTEENSDLPNNGVYGFLEDKNRNLWLSTNNGISRFNPSTFEFRNYSIDDGLQGEEYIGGSFFKSTSGEMFFGGIDGFNSFFPARVTDNKIIPSIVITDLKIFNESLTVGGNSPLKEPISKTRGIKLPYWQNDISFGFVSLHFANPSKNKYAFKLENYENNWRYVGQARSATYTNLDPGAYIFRVKGSNNDGIWNEEGTSVRLIITPPWWHTKTAYFSFFILFAFLIFMIDRAQRARLVTRERQKSELALLEAENKRKSEELEEARQLQLSMLPKTLPQLPNLDIAVYMKTATEVGGDYYDFHVDLNGTLTVVIGDATGHGMKAGTMVTAVKGLFNSYAPNPNILYSFQEMTRCIKQLNLGKLSMCMTMLKIQGDKMTMSSAGMPPSFIFRGESHAVEEHMTQGMPLGTMDKFPYKIEDSPLQAGDTILLLSDGLPELQNKQDEMYGYNRVRNVFEDIAEKEPEEIISFLKDEGSAWVDDKDPDDDVTFVVIKVK